MTELTGRRWFVIERVAGALLVRSYPPRPRDVCAHGGHKDILPLGERFVIILNLALTQSLKTTSRRLSPDLILTYQNCKRRIEGIH